MKTVEVFRYAQLVTLSLSAEAKLALLAVGASEPCLPGTGAFILQALLAVRKAIDQFYEIDTETLSDCRY